MIADTINMKEFVYRPQGVCSTKFVFEIDENNIIKKLVISDGCAGNAQGLSALLVGCHIDDIIEKLQDIKCGKKPTSCPMQIAWALKDYREKL